MKKVFVKPEMKSHKLRSGNILINVSGEDNPEGCRVLCPKLQCGDPYDCDKFSF